MRNRELKDSAIPWIGDIPISWEVIPHKRVMHKIKEIQEHYNGEDIISLTMRGVIVRDLDAGGKMPTSFDGYQKVYPNNLLQCLFDIDVTPRCVGLIKNEGLTSPAYSQFEMHSNAYAPYYDYLLRYMDDRKTLLHLSKNLRSSLTETAFGAIDTCVPSIIEQQKIANFLDRKCTEIDEMIALQEKIVEELKAYKQSVITEAVTKGLNPDVPMKDSGIEWIGEIPEHWRITTIGRLFRVSAGGDAKWDIYSDKQDSEHPFPVYTNTLDKNQTYAYTSIPVYKGDTITVTGRGDIGRAFYRKTPFDAIIRLLVLEKRYSLDCRYFAYFINNVIHFFTNSAAIGQLSAVQVVPYNLCHPSIEEQTDIADYLDTKCTEIDNLISIKLSKIDSLKEYKKSIIYEYVTGKKEV